MIVKTKRAWVRLLATVLLCANAHAEQPAAPALSQLAIVIDDLGYSRQRDQQALALPGKLTFAVLPGAPYAATVAASATAAGKEVILHQPMQPVGHIGTHAQDALHGQLSEQQFVDVLRDNLRAVPGIVGVNNHRGSLLTTSATAMDQLMAQLAQRNLYFLDSRTSSATVAHDTAKLWGVPTLKRDVFLDHVRTPEAVAREFRRALTIARRQGYAVMIAHPHAVSLKYLSAALQNLPVDVETVTLGGLLERSALIASGR